MHKIARRLFSPCSRALVFAVVLAAVTIFAYRPAWHGGFLWDDDAYIINNELLTTPDGWQRIWFSLDSPSQYFPFAYSTFRIEHALWGLNTTGYHWVNLLLHIGNAPLVSLAIGMGLLAVWWERYHQGTNRAVFTFLSPIERILVASRAVWFYLSKISLPSNLTFISPRWKIAPADLLDYVWLLAGIAAWVVIYFLRRYFGRSVEVAAAFFVVTLSPVLGFIMLFTFRYAFVADHYQYLACIAPIALASAGIVSLSGKFAQYRVVTVSVALLLVASLGALTWRQAATYTDIETLWRTTLARNPECWMAHTNLGIVLLQKGKIDDGIAHYRSALQMQPDSWDAEYNLGTALLAK